MDWDGALKLFFKLEPVWFVLSLLLLRWTYLKLKRRLIKGSYLLRGTVVLFVFLGAFTIFNKMNGEGFVMPLILGIEVALTFLLWTVRNTWGGRWAMEVGFWAGFIYLTVTGLLIAFFPAGGPWFRTNLDHFYIGSAWIPFFFVFCIDHIQRFETAIRDTTRKLGHWCGIFFAFSWLSGLNHGLFGPDALTSWKPLHWSTASIGGVLLALHLRQSWRHSRARGWDKVSRQFWPSMRILIPVGTLAGILSFVQFFLPASYVDTHGEMNWTREEAMEKLGNPVTGMSACTVNGSGLPERFISADPKHATCGNNMGCHVQVKERWERSAHRFSADPAYQKVVKLLIQDAGIKAARLCASCHDPVPLLTGKIVEGAPYPTEQSEGVNCVVCHSLRPAPSNLKNGVYHLIPQPAFFQSFVTSISNIGGYMLILDRLPEHSEEWAPKHLRDSRMCGSCHNISLNGHALRTTFDEWAEGPFGLKSENKKECITCHMPRIGILPDNGRLPLHDHQMAGSNIGIPSLYGGKTGEQVAFIRSVLGLAGTVVDREAGQGTLELVITNKEDGHGFPGAPRDLVRYWFEYTWNEGSAAEKWSRIGGDTIFKETLFDAQGSELKEHQLWRVATIEADPVLHPTESRKFRYTILLPETDEKSVVVRLMHQRFGSHFFTPDVVQGGMKEEVVEIMRTRLEM